ncbi:MAG: RNase adapter RapZ [Elusimicrobiota bacterium]|jgi:UPF0042 nucleotide-binding protein|nr:RNase adapter RapZ [Elusimicrobiota bacterium]
MEINFYIVSGMSGAGKSQVLKIFEDLGFVCIDNMPLQMMDDFARVCLKNQEKYKNVAVSVDSRAGTALKDFKNILSSLEKKKIKHKTIFLNCNDSVLIRRFSETRRRHPLGKSVHKSIKLERKMLSDVFSCADEVVDTSETTMGELKKIILRVTGASAGKEYLNVSVISFGYKYGIPSDVDIVYDVRFLINPNYVADLRPKTGKDAPVKNYIIKQPVFKRFFSEFTKLIETTLPGYIDEGKSYLTIAIGCTGGRHRSVFTAEELAHFLRSKKYKVNINHRDIDRWKN